MFYRLFGGPDKSGWPTNWPPDWHGESENGGPGGSDTRTQRPQGSDEKGGPQGPGGSRKNRTPVAAAKDQEEVTRGRKDHKEVTNNGEPRGPEGTGKRGAAPQGETTTKGDAPAKARDASRPVKSGSRSKLC